MSSALRHDNRYQRTREPTYKPRIHIFDFVVAVHCRSKMAMQIKDIFSRLYKITFDLFFYTAIIATILALLPENLFPTFPLNPNPYSNEHLFKGLYGHQWNNDLVINATFIGTSQLYGPESMVSVGEYIYTGLADGRLVRIHKTTEEIELVLQFSTLPECGK